MVIGIYGKELNNTYLPAIQNLITRLKNENVQLVMYDDYYDLLSQRIKLKGPIRTFSSYKEVPNFEMVLSIGGDGTFLSTLTLIRDSNVPVLGINTGRLGFLAAIATQEIDKNINLVLQKRYTIEERTLLSLDTDENPFGHLNYAMNEIALHKKDSASMIIIHSEIDGHYLNSYWADGLIVATPTGSTAYSLSCGGPIMVPKSNSFVITPIAPHNLNVRPIITPDSITIKLRAEGREDQFMISLDSRSANIGSQQELTIRKAPFKLNLIKPEGTNFYNTMRQKLMWGKDKRN